MKNLVSIFVRRAERRAAPWATKRPTSWTSPARIPSGDRPTYSSDEGQS
jgi:hypothetical protein